MIRGYDAWKTATPPEYDEMGEPEAEAERELDAYGHLTWTLGDDDWQACFDAVRVGNEIAYHVVVNCESGGWIDTLEKGVVPVSKAEELIGLPGRYVDSAIENHFSARQQGDRVGRLAYRGCEKRWARHIRQLIKESNR